MNKFYFTGRLAQTPKSSIHKGTAVTTFRLIRNEYAGAADGGERKERTVAISFVIFGPRGQFIETHTRTGDQLIVEATIRNNDYVVGDEKRYSYDFIAEDFELGARGRAAAEGDQMRSPEEENADT